MNIGYHDDQVKQQIRNSVKSMIENSYNDNGILHKINRNEFNNNWKMGKYSNNVYLYQTSDEVMNSTYATYQEAVNFTDEKKNAYDYLELLKDNRFKSAFVNKKYNWLKPFSPTYQVQIGPFGNKKDYNELILKLKKIGVYQTKIIQD